MFGGVSALLLQVVVQLHRAVKDAEDVDLVLARLQVDDAIVSPQQNASFTPGLSPISVAKLWKLLEDLGTGVD